MKKKTIITILCTLVAIMTIAIGSVTYAWLTDKDTTTPITYTMGDIEYEITAPVAATTVVPGQNLLPEGGFVITNKSTVASNIRVKIDVAATIVGGTEAPWTVERTTLGVDPAPAYPVTTGKTAQMLIVGETSWTLDTDGYWYLGTKTAPTSIAAAANPETGVAIDQLCSYLTVNGAVIGNTYDKATVKVTFTVESKQAEYVTWGELASIDFSTGLAA